MAETRTCHRCKRPIPRNAVAHETFAGLMCPGCYAKHDAEINRRTDEMRRMEQAPAELTTLATGKSSERLPFGVGKAAENITENITPGSDDALQAAFDVMPLAEIGVKSGLADKLAADGIRYGKDLREWVQNHARRDIKGVGPKAVENLSELMAEADAKAKADEPMNPEILDAAERLTRKERTMHPAEYDPIQFGHLERPDDDEDDEARCDQCGARLDEEPCICGPAGPRIDSVWTGENGHRERLADSGE